MINSINMPCVDHQRPEVRELLEDGGGTMLAIEPRRRLDIVAGDGGRRRADILVFGGLLNEAAFKGRSAEGLFTTMLSPVSNAAWEGVLPSSTPLSPSHSPSPPFLALFLRSSFALSFAASYL